MAPLFEQLAKEHPNAEFVKVDVDNAQAISESCGIMAMPTFQCYRGGEKVDEMQGANESGLKAMVARHSH